jgi:hypothetical protein
MSFHAPAAVRRHQCRAFAAALVIATATAVPAAAAPSQMYATDLHVHSTVSADARPDLGIIARNARAAGLNAVFLTDHNQASDFSISTRTANNAFFDAPTHDDLNRWTPVGAGVTQVASPVHTGTAATHIVSTGAEQYLWSVRGPNFRAGSGAVTTTFSIFPTTLAAGASVYVSASLGGDVTIQSTAPGPEGYTPAQSGVASSCKSVVFIWYFGAAPSTTPYQPTATACKVSPIPSVVVKEFPITAAQCDRAFTLNTWNTCTLNVDAAVATLAAADKPQPYLGLSELKVAASGSANVYFDDYATTKALPAGSTIDSRAGAEFADRNALIPTYDDPAGNFRMFPSLEEGTSNHAQRFNFAITAPGQYMTFCNGTCNYANGYTGIAPTEASGYPAQLNHPGVAGGVSDAQATGSCPNGLTPACGADVMEVRQRNMATDWDTILKSGTPLVGSFGSDNHVGAWSGSSMATYLFSPSNGFDDLMQSLFEGRGYDAPLGTSTTRMSMLFNVGTSAAEPYPARYPLFVPAGQSVSLHVDITRVKAGSSVRWVQNGVIGANEAATGGNYSATRTLTMSGTSAYARVETGTSATANADSTTQPIMLKPAAAGVPSGMTYHVERVTPPAGAPAFTKGLTKGITASSWAAATQALTLTLSNTVGSLAEVRITSATAPTAVTANGTAIPAAASLAAFQAATGPSRFYDGAVVYVKEKATTTSDTVVVAFGAGGGDTTPPTAPGTPAATTVGTTTAAISWTASTDNVGVTRYDVSRNGVVVGSATPPASGNPTFGDAGLTPATTYSYVVTAFDAAGNHTASPTGTVTTQAAGGGGTTTLVASADAKVDASTPATNFATAALRVDASPDVRSYVKFNATGLTGTVQSATLRIWAASAQSVGFDAFKVGDTSWTEAALTYANQPSASIGAKLGSSGPVAAASWTTVDVTALVTGPGVYSVVLETTSVTALALASREDAAHAPQLVVTTA